MPGWHEATKAIQAEGRVRMVGIVQEQHPERARLFMQWKQMDWPIMVDSLGLLGVKVVPITIFIDEAGIVRRLGARRPAELDAFLEREPVEPEPAAAAAAAPLDNVITEPAPAEIMAGADAMVTWGGAAALDDAVASYEHLLATGHEPGPAHFRLGVALRKRFESAARRPGDFAGAVRHWRAALETDPDQYIWRRRIQQYGPRDDKPYSFYDWVGAARDEIVARGEAPVALPVEPSGAEFAAPARGGGAGETGSPAPPDPEGRVRRDERGFITATSIVVPHTSERRRSARVHVMLRPDNTIDAHWNNEAEPLSLWLDPPAGWTVERRLLRVPNPPAATSTELRSVEFEVRPDGDGPRGPVTIPAYVLYNVCEGAGGRCLYRRQDLTIRIGEAGTSEQEGAQDRRDR